MGQFVRHEACPACKSSDALARYAAGDASCFSCGKYFRADGTAAPGDDHIEDLDNSDWRPIAAEYMPIMKRGLTEETCRKAGYQIGHLSNGTKVHVANIYNDERHRIGQKTRDKDKNFSWNGPAKKNPPMYLQWTWPTKGKSVILTEGELDALSYWQAWDHKWPVGSLMNGADAVEKDIQRAYERLLGFDTIYLAFDADEPGRNATEKACKLLPVGRVKLITFPQGCKDANDALLKHGKAALIKAFYDAKEWRPDGLREGKYFTRERMKETRKTGYSLPYPLLNMMWLGSRDGEITTIAAGSGIGKSTIARDFAYHMRMEHDLKVGNIFLEEDNDTSVKAYVGLHQGLPLKTLIATPEALSDDQWDASLAAVIHDNMIFYDHFGSLESDRLLMMMRYMAAMGCRRIVLDHISIVVSGLESNDERKDIDVLMTKLASFVKETGVSVIAVVHLKRSVGGVDFNAGGQISLRDMRGSASIEQLSFNVLAAERNQQDEQLKAFAQLRSLKCRVTGETGEADLLKWNVAKGRYEVVDKSQMDIFNPHEDTEKDEVF